MNGRVSKIIRATGLNRWAYRTAKKEYVATPYPENLRAIKAYRANGFLKTILSSKGHAKI